ncbi:MAG: multicopper oxidase family protein [Chloroflexota bacterium]
MANTNFSQSETQNNENVTFSTDATGLPMVVPTETVDLRDGDVFTLHISSVAKDIDSALLRMLAYNGSIPGPTLHVQQGSEITVHVINDGDVEATVHWHGLRLENRYDGTPHDTQPPIPVGGTFTYRVQFPDAGLYWYHPHIREDYTLEMGLYGTILVEPSDPAYWPPVDRQLTLTLDDLLVEDGHIAPFLQSGPNYTAMGRFGNVLLINGETAFAGRAARGEVVRLNLVNTANTRIFNFALQGARMKLVGGDSGRYERETFVEAVLLAPSERAIIDVLFESDADVHLEHRTPDRIYDLGSFSVVGISDGTAGKSFDVLRTDPQLVAEHEAAAQDVTRAPDKLLSFVAHMPLLYGHDDSTAASLYSCPMHPDVTSTTPGTCRLCGMKLLPVASEPVAPTSYTCPMHPDVISATPGKCPLCGMKLLATADMHEPTPAAHEHTEHNQAHGEHAQGDGLEWEDLMPQINRESNSGNMVWQLIDQPSGAVNGAISWTFAVGDRVKIRLINEMESDHPMHHPFHIHGAGRFLVLSRGGQPEDNYVWKDTVLLRAGETVDILLDVTNPGLWMAHCHIAEHAQSGMMFSINVDSHNSDAGPGSMAHNHSR